MFIHLTALSSGNASQREPARTCLSYAPALSRDRIVSYHGALFGFLSPHPLFLVPSRCHVHPKHQWRCIIKCDLAKKARVSVSLAKVNSHGFVCLSSTSIATWTHYRLSLLLPLVAASPLLCLPADLLPLPSPPPSSSLPPAALLPMKPSMSHEISPVPHLPSKSRFHMCKQALTGEMEKSKIK